MNPPFLLSIDTLFDEILRVFSLLPFSVLSCTIFSIDARDELDAKFNEVMICTKGVYERANFRLHREWT